MNYRFLFAAKQRGHMASLFLLVMRVAFGLLLLNHGIAKWQLFPTPQATFPDPLGIGTTFSLGLAIFAELFCSIALIFGLLTRLALIPMIITMCVIFFQVHAGDPLMGGGKELSLMYLINFVLLFLSGPGRFSLDCLIENTIEKNKSLAKKEEQLRLKEQQLQQSVAQQAEKERLQPEQPKQPLPTEQQAEIYTPRPVNDPQKVETTNQTPYGPVNNNEVKPKPEEKPHEDEWR